MRKLITATIIVTILLITLITTAAADENKNRFENQFEVKIKSIDTTNENDSNPIKLQINVKKVMNKNKKENKIMILKDLR